MKGRHRIVIHDTKPILHTLRKPSKHLLFDDHEWLRSRMYKIIEEPF